MHYAQGEYAAAGVHLRASAEAFREIGARWDLARVLKDLGRTTYELGDHASAKGYFLEALDLATEAGTVTIALEALADLALLQLEGGQPNEALELVLQVLQHPASSQEARDSAEELLIRLEAQLSREQIAAAQAQARSFDAVMEETLGSSETSGDEVR
jgi:tetratricopeptide (TPR) repeat protein